MSLLKHISNFIIEKVLPIKFKVWLLDRLACDIASQGEDGDTELAHINSYEAKLLKSVGGSGTTTAAFAAGGGPPNVFEDSVEIPSPPDAPPVFPPSVYLTNL